MSFAGSFKSMIGGDTICDHYNASTKSYCKRLKVICAEHAKDPKVSETHLLISLLSELEGWKLSFPLFKLTIF